MSHGGEEVVPKCERILLGVDLVDIMILLGEDVESVFELFLGSNEETLLLDVVHEHLSQFVAVLVELLAVFALHAHVGAYSAENVHL